MRYYAFLVFLLFSFHHSIHAQSYGLSFYSHEVVPEKRTSLNLTAGAPLCLKQETEISFDLSFIPYHDIYFGYIFRLIFTNGQNIDLVYNQRTGKFDFLIGEGFSQTFTIDTARLYRQWNKCSVRIDPRRNEASFYINGKLIGRGPGNFGEAPCCRVFFGANNFEGYQMLDIPPMNIRDIVIREKGKIKYSWPLSESSGNLCKDVAGGKTAEVKNPGWIRPRHQNWQLARSLKLTGFPSVAFDKKHEILYIVSADSLHKVALKTMQFTGIRLTEKHDTLLPGNQSVYDPFLDKLYNVYIDQKKVSVYDTVARKWNAGFTPALLTVYWHANKFISSYDTSLYVLAGYGQLEYKNRVQRYALATGQWDTLLTTTGDRLMPRYLAALGANKAGDTAYIIGGYGSNTGSQVVNPKYYYDLLSFSVKDRSFKTHYRLEEPAQQFCFANSLVIDDEKKEYYALVYPNDKFNSSLQLIKGSLVSPQYQLLGNAMPYTYHDVQSFADLYYCPDSKKLVGVTIYTSKENVADVKVYTMAFPPNPVTGEPPAVAGPHWSYLGLLLVVLAMGFLWVWRRRIKDRRQTAAPEQPFAAVTPAAPSAGPVDLPVIPPAEQEEKRARIFLFGQFEVYDKEGNDITRLFTPLLKELFLIIAIYTLRYGKGIAAEKLYATLWRDKSSKEARNNRSVNMVKLKAILDKLGTAGFIKEADRWSLHYLKEEINIDLDGFLQLCRPVATPAKKDVENLLRIVQRGALLADTAYPWLDDIQSEISATALSVLSAATVQFSEDPEFLIAIANGIFVFDPVNEEALRVKCRSLGLLGRHSMARALFNKFAKEYYHMYGEEFQGSFSEVFN
jgi:DNA-binding SARP family transcriptional activator